MLLSCEKLHLASLIVAPRTKKHPPFGGCFHGTPGGIRTHDLLIRSQALYPAELRAHGPLARHVIDYTTGGRGL